VAETAQKRGKGAVHPSPAPSKERLLPPRN
jgi:hypothetical protein